MHIALCICILLVFLLLFFLLLYLYMYWKFLVHSLQQAGVIWQVLQCICICTFCICICTEKILVRSLQQAGVIWQVLQFSNWQPAISVDAALSLAISAMYLKTLLYFSMFLLCVLLVFHLWVLFFCVFSCPGSSIPDLGHWVTEWVSATFEFLHN